MSMTASGSATLIVSIDVEFPDVTWGAEFAELERAARELLGRLNGFAIPATWGMTDVAHPLGDEIVHQSSHELAIHANSSLVGSHLPRGTFISQMQRRLGQARQAGHVPTTLNLASGCRVGHLDTLARFGITALRAAPLHVQSQTFWQHLANVGRRPHVEMRPHMARWGVWQFPAELTVPGVGLSAGRRAIDRAIQQGSTVHISVDLRTIAQDHRTSRAVLDGLLRHAEQRRTAGQLHTLTVDQTVARTTQQHQGRPSRSILSRAA
jgi:hypothetical protein